MRVLVGMVPEAEECKVLCLTKTETQGLVDVCILTSCRVV